MLCYLLTLCMSYITYYTEDHVNEYRNINKKMKIIETTHQHLPEAVCGSQW